MSRILLIETATEVCSAAIAVNGHIVAMEEEPQSLNHAALLTLQIEACTKASGIPLAELDAVAVSRGPGSYTSLRVGASVAKGICYALDKPLIAVNTLLALASASREAFLSNPQSAIHNPQFPIPHPIFIPMLDARRQEVWLAVFDAQLREIATEQPLILENDLFEKFVRQAVAGADEAVLVIGGNGGMKVENAISRENVVMSSIKKCSAKYLAGLAEQNFQSADFQDVAYFEPFYMKAPNITTPSKALF
ncbi:MAG: tRNA (adenosine(37)-N6)-threonylcarbamoyltransferase complex dimerization subunit type 1 TsaB [Haliscomenobacteraceae bacterium CHB4]|nr:tRNA N6-adenosine threonylcarbamoyltransferase [Saprospiraceae bacterium]MCE7924087.1 tRNA (adenosine(37)-N6)-threonylcarbamoyltransferase complex dimerization subunit type 1 TsaB [Haliscomenobacteraceae bacterium CHB4]